MVFGKGGGNPLPPGSLFLLLCKALGTGRRGKRHAEAYSCLQHCRKEGACTHKSWGAGQKIGQTLSQCLFALLLDFYATYLTKVFMREATKQLVAVCHHHVLGKTQIGAALMATSSLWPACFLPSHPRDAGSDADYPFAVLILALN